MANFFVIYWFSNIIEGSFHLKSLKKRANLNGPNPDFDECIHMVLVTQIEGIQGFFLNLTSYFQIYGTFKFYENVNFRGKGLFKNPHCTKYMSQNNLTHVF